MGNRLRDYGFVNPFRADSRGSNYNESLHDLTGKNIDQFLVDVATYNTIIRDYGLTSQLEYKQPDGSWGTAVPPRPATKVKGVQERGAYGLDLGTKYTEVKDSRLSQPTPESELVKTLPEYRWRISGDVNGANQALQAAGLQGSYTGPRGHKFTTGQVFKEIIPAKSEELWSKGATASPSQRVGKIYLSTDDPLGAGIGGSDAAFDRAYGGVAAPQYYTFPNIVSSNRQMAGVFAQDVPYIDSQSYGGWYAKQVADEVFKNPNLGSLIYEPATLKAALSATPAIRNEIGKYFDDTASFFRARDDGGGALGVIAKGLTGVAQFASMAAGLNAGVSFLGSLAKGANLAGAYGAAKAGASAIPSLGGGIAQLAGKPGLSNIISSGIGAFTGGVQGGLPGAALGAVSGYVPGLPGAAIGQIGRAAGIGAPPSPPQAPPQFALSGPVDASLKKFQAPGSSLMAAPTPWAFEGSAPTSPAGTVASTLAAQAPAPIAPQAAIQTPVASTIPMGAQTPFLSSAGLLGGAMNPQLRQLMAAAPRGGLLTGGLGNVRPLTFGGMPVNQQAIMANLPQVLANIRSRAGGAPPAAA